MKIKFIYIIFLTFMFATQINEDISLSVAKNVFEKHHETHNKNNFSINICLSVSSVLFELKSLQSIFR